MLLNLWGGTVWGLIDSRNADGRELVFSAWFWSIDSPEASLCPGRLSGVLCLGLWVSTPLHFVCVCFSFFSPSYGFVSWRSLVTPSLGSSLCLSSFLFCSFPRREPGESWEFPILSNHSRYPNMKRCPRSEERVPPTPDPLSSSFTKIKGAVIDVDVLASSLSVFAVSTPQTFSSRHLSCRSRINMVSFSWQLSSLYLFGCRVGSGSSACFATVSQH